MRPLLACICVITLGGCTSGSLNHALGTPKNPTPIFADPRNTKIADDQSLFIQAQFGVLLEAVGRDASDRAVVIDVPEGYNMRRYIAAGYSLADIYCGRYFTKTDEASRRRRFGRTLTNDLGTAATTALNLANAGADAVAGLAAATGLADSAWRNYDDSFVISPEIATVRTLVLAAQDNFRERTLGKNAELPADFGTAHSTIRRYAELCSHLGMKALLEQAATEQKTTLTDETEELKQPVPPSPLPAAPVESPSAPAIVAPSPKDRPAAAVPALTSNSPD